MTVSQQLANVYNNLLRSCELVFAAVPTHWQAWPSMSYADREAYLTYNFDDACRYFRRLREARTKGELDAEQLARLDQVEKLWNQFEPIVDAMEKSVNSEPRSAP